MGPRGIDFAPPGSENPPAFTIGPEFSVPP